MLRGRRDQLERPSTTGKETSANEIPYGLESDTGIVSQTSWY